MAIDTYLSTCIYAAIGGAGVLVLAYLYRDYRIDRMRDELFAARDELFDYAVQEELLEHPGYQRLRNTYNGMLRFCHKVSFFRLLVSIILEDIFIQKEQRRNPYAEWIRIVDELPALQKDRLIKFHLRMFTITLRYMVETSLFLAPAVSLLRVIHLFGRARASMLQMTFMRKTERGWQIIEGQALES